MSRCVFLHVLSQHLNRLITTNEALMYACLLPSCTFSVQQLSWKKLTVLTYMKHCKGRYIERNKYTVRSHKRRLLQFCSPHFRIVWSGFKVAGLVHQSLAGVTPHTSLMTVACSRMPAVARCGRIPMNCGTCSYRADTRKLGDWSFSVAGPRLWNDLPPRLRPGLSFDTFKQSLETYLFGDQSA